MGERALPRGSTLPQSTLRSSLLKITFGQEMSVNILKKIFSLLTKLLELVLKVHIFAIKQCLGALMDYMDYDFLISLTSSKF